MSLLSSWPTITDDSGDGVSGTEIEKSVFDAIKASVEDQVHSLVNTTVKPKTITDEVIDARGNLASLDDRISGVIDDDGNLLTPGSLISQTQLESSLHSVNLVKNDTFLIWPDGPSAAPAYWVAATSTIARSTSTRKVGVACAAVTNAGSLTQTILDSGSYSAAADVLDGVKVSFGCWVNTSIASHAKITVTDGAISTSSTNHTGAVGWEWLTVTHTISASATKLEVKFEVLSNGTAYFDGPTLIMGAYATDNWLPAPKAYGFVLWSFTGTPITGDGQRHIVFSRPTFIKAVQAFSKSAATGADFTIDIEKGNGDATWTSIFAGAVTLINDTKRFGNVAPAPADYGTRCMPGVSIDADDAQAGTVLRLNIDTVAAVADVIIQVRTIQWMNPLEDFLADDDVN